MPYIGRGLAIGIGVETAWGTAVARTHWFRGVSESLKRTITRRERPVLAGAAASGNIRSMYVESDNAGGTIEVLCGYEGMGLLFAHIFSATPATTGPVGAIYTHVYTIDAAPPTGGLTIEVVRGDGTAEVFEGCRIAKATFKIEKGGLMRVACEIIAETSAGRTSAGSPVYTANDLDVLHHQAGTVGWNSQTYTPGDFEFTLDNKYARRQLLGSKLTKEPKPSAFVECKCKLGLEWENDNLWTALLADTESDLTLTFTGTSSRTMLFTLHNAILEDVSDPVNAVGVVAQTGVFRGQSDGTDEGIKLTVANTQALATTV